MSFQLKNPLKKEKHLNITYLLRIFNTKKVEMIFFFNLFPCYFIKSAVVLMLLLMVNLDIELLISLKGTLSIFI